MSTPKKCVFCGEPFSGQKKNFEHIIPKWLVAEADLNKRSTPVFFPSKRFDAGMSRLGLRACETCNSAASELEGRAQAAYSKIKNGDVLETSDALALMDWLDKLRVGLWLWLVDAGKADFTASPKFRINQRMAYKDRIVAIARYAEAPDLRGMAIWGSGHFFVFAPSCIGFLINNIAILSLSSDFLLARHLRSLSIQQFPSDAALWEHVVEPEEALGRRLRLLSSPTLFGQCILPELLFDKLALPGASPSVHKGLSAGPVVRLDSALQEIAGPVGAVPQYIGKVSAPLALLELDLARTVQFVIGDLLEANLDRLKEPARRLEIKGEIQHVASLTDDYVEECKQAYFQASGLALPI